jgi:hypothetical protein
VRSTRATATLRISPEGAHEASIRTAPARINDLPAYSTFTYLNRVSVVGHTGNALAKRLVVVRG